MAIRREVGTIVTTDTPSIFLSPPDITQAEVDAVTAAMRSGWVAPAGPHIAEFEAAITEFTGIPYAVALSSGTAAIHLGLRGVGVTAGDEVVIPSMTFAATAFAAVHAGATPVFVDVQESSWCLDPALLAQLLDRKSRSGRLPAAIVTVDIFGRPCDYDSIMEIADSYSIPVIDDAAEALGTTHAGGHVGGFGRAGVFSFNGNKIMTTSGGGMLVTHDEQLAARILHWSTQAREPQPWYEHNEIGHNYRLSNISAALGCAQVARLPAMIERRQRIFALYSQAVADIEGVEAVADPPWGTSNHWLTTIRFDLDRYPNAPTRARELLARHLIEARPVWKPLDRQPVFADAETLRSGVSDRLFATGLCLPSGSKMTDDDVARVMDLVRTAIGSPW
ncbi:MAG: aminotransferase class I/II-fold pyridoxal phosphate-dependent enzyme [Actinomycetes bacterium]